MKNLMTAEQLIEFENDIAERFQNKMILAPIHLHFGNEQQLIEIFKHVQPEDHCVCTWRSHYHCLLKGMSPSKVREDVLIGRSIEMCNREYKIFSSAIVGGNIPIALGLSLDVKRKNGKEKVWCFVGDMGATTGAFFEAYTYAELHKLPINFVIEDNGKSVCTSTRKVWNTDILRMEPFHTGEENYSNGKVYSSINGRLWYYKYDLNFKYPHAGPGGKRIQF